MDEKKKEIEEKIIDLKGAINAFVREEPEELSQIEEIKAYDDKTDSIIYKKKKKNNEDDDDEDDDKYNEQLKRLKKQLIDSLNRVDLLAKKIFNEKEHSARNFKVKTSKSSKGSSVTVQKDINLEKTKEEEKQNNMERSRE